MIQRLLKFALAALCLVVGCKKVMPFTLKDDPSPADAAGPGQVAGESADCAPATQEGGPDPRYTQAPTGSSPTDLLAAAAPAWSSAAVDPDGERTPMPCANPTAKGPPLSSIKLNPGYSPSTPDASAGSASGGATASLRLDDGTSGTDTASGDDPSVPAPAGSSSTATSGASGTPDAGDDTTRGAPCTADLPQAKLSELYGAHAGTLPDCQADGFTDWLSRKNGQTLPKPTASTAPDAPPQPADTRESYEKGVFALLKDVKTIESNGAAGLADSDPWSLLSDRDASSADPNADLPDPDDVTDLGVNSDVDQLEGQWDALDDMATLLAGDGPTATDPDNAVALTDAGSQNTPQDVNGLKSWQLGSSDFNIGFSLGFGAQFGVDQSVGYDTSDKALQPAGGERSPKTFVYKEYTSLKQDNAQSGLSIGGGPAMDVTLFGQKFPAVGKAYITGQAFSTVTKDNVNYKKPNGIELGFQLFGSTLWKKTYGGCDADSGTCKDGKAQDGSMRQSLAWLGRAAKGRYAFTIGPVPMDAQWTVQSFVGYSWNIAMTLDSAGTSAQLAAGFFPRIKSGVSLSGGINFVGQRAGVRGDLTLFNIGPTGVLGATAVLKDGSLSFCPFVKSDFQYEFLSGSLSAYAQLWYVISSKYFQLTLYKWKGWSNKIPLFAPADCSSALPAATAGSGGASTPNALEQVNQAAQAKKPRLFRSIYNDDDCIDQDVANDASHVYVYKCHGGTNQQFTFDAVDNGGGVKTGSIVSQDGKCLDLNFTQTVNEGYKLYLGGCHGGSNQTFSLHPDGTITDGMKGYCIDFDVNRQDGGGWILYSHVCNGAGSEYYDNQRWSLE